MARVDLVTYPVLLAQTALTAKEVTGTADDMQILSNTGDQFLYIRNTDGAATRTVTAVANGTTANGETYANQAITVAISGTTLMGPFEPAVFNTAANAVEIDLDAGNEGDLEVVCLSFARAR